MALVERQREFEIKRAKQLFILEKGLAKFPLEKGLHKNLAVKKVDRNKNEIMKFKAVKHTFPLV